VRSLLGILGQVRWPPHLRWAVTVAAVIVLVVGATVVSSRWGGEVVADVTLAFTIVAALMAILRGCSRATCCFRAAVE
jgi:hypothetical protein